MSPQLKDASAEPGRSRKSAPMALRLKSANSASQVAWLPNPSKNTDQLAGSKTTVHAS